MAEHKAGKRSFQRKFLRPGIGVAAILASLICVPASSRLLRAQQTGDASLPSFEVASIKLNKSPLPLPGGHLYGGRYNATATALAMIQGAYGRDGHSLSRAQVSGGPDWIKSEMFDIDAKVEDSLVEGEWKKLSVPQRMEQVRPMIQSLLADRFKLRVRHETKVLPVYVLVLAKNGPKFAEDNSHPELGGIGVLGAGRLEAKSSSLSRLVSVLPAMPELGGRLVLDKTDLKGNYSFTLQWAPDLANGAQSADSVPQSSLPSLFTALQEQLGVKLESTKAPVDTIVIDHIEEPSPN